MKNDDSKKSKKNKEDKKKLEDLKKYTNLFSCFLKRPFLSQPVWANDEFVQLWNDTSKLHLGTLKKIKWEPAPHKTLDFSCLHGPFWPGHPFKHEPLCWWKSLNEMDVTGLIYFFLNAEELSGVSRDARIISRDRTQIFLCALFAAASPQVPPFPELSAESRGIEFDISREKHICHENRDGKKGGKKKGERLDLVIEWKASGAPRVVLIEVKFGAGRQNGFGEYKKWAASKAKGVEENYHCFLLDVNESAPPTGWWLTPWIIFLREWERRIANGKNRLCDDMLFSQARQSIWRKLYEQY